MPYDKLSPLKNNYIGTRNSKNTFVKNSRKNIYELIELEISRHKSQSINENFAISFVNKDKTMNADTVINSTKQFLLISQ